MAIINDDLIPSAVTDSAAPTVYSYSAVVEGNTFYIEMVSLNGGGETFGPYAAVDAAEDMRPTIWLPTIHR